MTVANRIAARYWLDQPTAFTLAKWTFEDAPVGATLYSAHNSGNGSTPSSVATGITASNFTVSPTAVSDGAQFRDRSDTIWTGKTRDICAELYQSINTNRIDLSYYGQFGIAAAPGKGLYLKEVSFLVANNSAAGSGTDARSGYGASGYTSKKVSVYASFDNFKTQSQVGPASHIYGYDSSSGINADESIARVRLRLTDPRFTGCNAVDFRLYWWGGEADGGSKVRIDDIEITGTGGEERSTTKDSHARRFYVAQRLTTSGCADSTQGLILNDSNTSIPVGHSYEGAGVNYNGPSIVKIPSWVATGDRADPSANYYLYYGHHDGQYIRMAWAASIEGPWTYYRATGDKTAARQRTSTDGRGVLDFGTLTTQYDMGNTIVVPTYASGGHLSSPFIYLDNVNEQFVLLFHARTTWTSTTRPRAGFVTVNQHTMVATSSDGLNFHSVSQGGQVGHGLRESAILAPFYLNPFNIRGRWYGFENQGRLWQSPLSDPFNLTPTTTGQSYHWTQVNSPLFDDFYFSELALSDEWTVGTNYYYEPRHTFTRVLDGGDRLEIWYTAKAQIPERIIRAEIITESDDPADWWLRRVNAERYLPPATLWENIDKPWIEGQGGSNYNGNPECRDPIVFEDSDSSLYLVYSGGGEQGIGIASLTPSPATPPTTDADAQALITAIETSDGQSLESGVAEAINLLYLELKGWEQYGSIDTLILCSAGRSLASSLIPAKGTAPTNVGSLSNYDRKLGIKGSGSGYLNTNLQQVDFGSDAVSFFCDVSELSTDSGMQRIFGYRSTQARNTALWVGYDQSNVNFSLCVNTSHTSIRLRSPEAGFLCVSRLDSTRYLYLSESSVGEFIADSRISSTVGRDLFLHARSDWYTGSQVITYGTNRIGVYGVGYHIPDPHAVRKAVRNFRDRISAAIA